MPLIMISPMKVKFEYNWKSICDMGPGSLNVYYCVKIEFEPLKIPFTFIF